MTMKQPRIAPLLVAGLVTLLSGCASQPSRAVTDIGAVRRLASVSVSQTVSAPDYLVYFGQTQSLGGLFLGNLGAFGARPSAEEVGRRLDAALAARETSIKRIVRESLAEHIRATGVPAPLVEGGAEAEFRLVVEFYELAGKSRLSSELVPTLRVHGSLVSSSGNMLWENTLVVDTGDPSQTPKPVEAFFADPNQLEAVYRNASGLIVNQFLQELRAN